MWGPGSLDPLGLVVPGKERDQERMQPNKGKPLAPSLPALALGPPSQSCYYWVFICHKHLHVIMAYVYKYNVFIVYAYVSDFVQTAWLALSQ